MLVELQAGPGENVNGRFRRRSRSVTTAGADTEADIHHALFRYTDQSAGSFDTGEYMFHHGTPLVQNKCRADILTAEMIHDFLGTVSVDLFAAGESKIAIVFGTEAR